MEKWLKIKAMFQSILEPIETQAKQAFVNALRPVNQSYFAGSQDLQALADHPKISQTRSKEQTA